MVKQHVFGCKLIFFQNIVTERHVVCARRNTLVDQRKTRRRLFYVQQHERRVPQPRVKRKSRICQRARRKRDFIRKHIAGCARSINGLQQFCAYRGKIPRRILFVGSDGKTLHIEFFQIFVFAVYRKIEHIAAFLNARDVNTVGSYQIIGQHHRNGGSLTRIAGVCLSVFAQALRKPLEKLLVERFGAVRLYIERDFIFIPADYGHKFYLTVVGIDKYNRRKRSGFEFSQNV